MDQTESVLTRVGTSMMTALQPEFELFDVIVRGQKCVNLESFKNVIETPHGWTNVTYYFNSQQCLDTNYVDRRSMHKKVRLARYFSAAHPQQSIAVRDQKIWQPHIVPCAHHKWHTDTV